MIEHTEITTLPSTANEPLNIGLDVGSTTVKAVVMDSRNQVLSRVYQRHNARQPELVLTFLHEIERLYPGLSFRSFITGSGARSIAPLIKALYVQEVNAVTYAVEQLHPDTGSVIELGGQDAKVIIWKEDEQGRKSALTFMNDKCAGGTGATIDRILAKTGASSDRISEIRASGKTLHHIAAKCGVFAETDVVGLLKAGIDPEEIVASLCNAIVKQNLEVLVRGNVLRDRVLLLGGPHRYLPVLTDLWREHIPQTWKLHRWEPRGGTIEELIRVPSHAHYFAAMGAVLFGRESESLFADFHHGSIHDNWYSGANRLEKYINHGRMAKLESSGVVREGLAKSPEEVQEFSKNYALPRFTPPDLPPPGSTLSCYIGIDGGSTSSKLALINDHGELVYRDYVLSRGNPIIDVRDMFRRIREWTEENHLSLDIRGTAATGYAASILSQAFQLDTTVVETVAHMRSAVESYGEIDVICDVGGQDIKVLFMKHGRVADFKLNTQCSAGNGFFLQSMAQQFGIPIEKYADCAFRATKAPAFNYGCAVFMEQDRVNFQQMGWTNEEIMAGLALVLPLNIWNYVVQDVNIARYGFRFVLQGGTQKNLAAVKAQVEYIFSKVPHAEIHVHRYAEVCGAIGAALESRFSYSGRTSAFIGIQQAATVEYLSRNDASTRCGFCVNRCPRTFIDISSNKETGIRFITGYGCDKGMSEDSVHMRAREQEKRTILDKNPNLVHQAATSAFEEFTYEEYRGKRSQHSLARRRDMVVGIPRVLNLYYYAPFFSTYLRSLGIGSVVYSDYTSQKLWSEGNKFGAIDPCFPAKVAPAHVYNLMRRKGITHICFPRLTHLESIVENTQGNNACPIQMGTPEVVDAAFTKGADLFGERGISYWKPLVNLERSSEAADQLFEYFEDALGLSRKENAWAVRQGFAAMSRFLAALREKSARVMIELIHDNRIGILALGHPYHHDPGLNHGILEEFQLRGYPIFSIESLPIDETTRASLFGQAGHDIEDVWKRNFNRNINLKIWAAKYASRHPNLAVVDFSSFKCGFDAPTYSYIDAILDASETPHFLFHDIDQNRPRATFDIRIQTIDYFLQLERKRLRERVGKHALV